MISGRAISAYYFCSSNGREEMLLVEPEDLLLQMKNLVVIRRSCKMLRKDEVLKHH
jgi:hypothetical protein